MCGVRFRAFIIVLAGKELFPFASKCGSLVPEGGYFGCTL
jgi:hypothetical protein